MHTMKKSVQKLLDELMRRYSWKSIDDINWICISRHQGLSEDFIREFKNKIYWHRISHWQNLSYEFISEFRNELNLKVLIHRKLITEEQIKEMYKPITRSDLIDIL
jgi:hypothetical protein